MKAAVRSTARIQAHGRGFSPNAATAGIQLVEAAESNIAQGSVKHPWQVIVEDRLSGELFKILEATVSRTNYSVITVKTQKNCVFVFAAYNRVRKVFSDLTDQNLTKEHFLKRK